MTPIQREKIKANWLALAAKTHEHDHEKAAFFARLAVALPTQGEFVLFCCTTLEQAGVQAHKHWRMAQAYKVVKGVQMWRAVGWAGIRLLVAATPEVQTALQIDALNAYKGGAALERSEWMEIVARHAPELLPARRASADEDEVDVGRLEADNQLLAATVRRLVAAAPILKGTMSDAEKVAAGLTRKRKAVRGA